MKSARELAIDVLGSGSRPPESPIASWYATGSSDGLGDRLLMFDNTGAASLELLRFRPEFAAASAFERALRASVDRLARFKHPSFAEIRGVQCLDGQDGLTLVTTHTPGKRLSEVIRSPRPPLGIHPAFAAGMIRQLTPALADLHAQGTGIAHGALTADRIVLTGDGHVVVVEHVLGQALDQLRLSAGRLWRELGIVTRTTGEGVPRLDGPGDVMQLALVALSVLLGRRVTPDEYPHNLTLLLDEFSENAIRRSPSLVPPLRLWLERALQLHGGFESAHEASEGLRELQPADRRPLAFFPETRMNDASIASVRESSGFDDQIANQSWNRSSAASEPWTPKRFEMPQAAEPATVTSETPQSRGLFSARTLASVLAFVALAQAAVIGGFLINRAAVPAAAASGPVTIESPASGDLVMVNGQQVGVTPLNLRIAPTVRSIRVIAAERQAAVVPVMETPVAANTAPAEARARLEAQMASTIAQAAARQRSGGVRLVSPIELQVFDGERVLGSSADGPIITTAGVHELDLVNNALGFRTRQRVEIKTGQIMPLTITPPDGRVSINALPWAQVSIDGRGVGETPLANVAVPVGEHEITFRHPQLGERTEKIVVKSAALIRVSATFNR